MKNILALLALVSSSAFALTETKVATCDMRYSGYTKVIGTMTIYSSDNGDEGFLRFKYTLTDVASNMDGEFTDNVQDDGAAFLNPGMQKLYVPMDGSVDPRGGPHTAAVYLRNHGKSITGLLKDRFMEADLNCKKK